MRYINLHLAFTFTFPIVDCTKVQIPLRRPRDCDSDKVNTVIF